LNIMNIYVDPLEQLSADNIWIIEHIYAWFSDQQGEIHVNSIH
jgi:hypothetical protein